MTDIEPGVSTSPSPANPSPASPSPARRRAPRVRLALFAALLIGAAAGGILYGMNGLPGKQTVAQCKAAQAIAARIDPLAHGEVAAFSTARTPEPIPALTFSGPGDAQASLADFHGRTVLLNLWATWCVPCRREMPALDRLQATLGGPAFQVVAVNIDTARLDRPQAFLIEAGVKNLGFYRDRTADIFQTLRSAGKVVGLPTSILIDPNGCEIGTLAGGAEWNSRDALALIKAAAGS